MKTYAYPVTLEAGDEPGVVIATFADVPEAITEGDGRAETLAQAGEALGLALLTYLRVGRSLPRAGAGGLKIGPPPEIAAKLAVIEAFAASAWTKSEFARRLGKDEKEARRILDPRHPTKLGPLTAALALLGRRLVVGVEKAA